MCASTTNGCCWTSIGKSIKWLYDALPHTFPASAAYDLEFLNILLARSSSSSSITQAAKFHKTSEKEKWSKNV